MASSSAKKLQNDIATYEKSSDRSVPSASYYIIKITLTQPDPRITTFVKDILKGNLYKELILAYIFATTIYLLFSSVEGEDQSNHQFGGSHQMLCSEFTSLFALKFVCKTTASIVEFDVRTKILIYFQTKVYENTRNTLLAVVGKGSAKLTYTELIDEFNTKSQKTWEATDPDQRFGTFYKFIRERSKFSTLSQPINILEIESYDDYFFG